MRAIPSSYYTLFKYLYVSWSICSPGWGTVITSSASTLSGTYSFSSYDMWCGGAGVLSLALHIISGDRDSDMVTVCGSTLEGVWVLILFCSTILVYVLVVSSLVFL